MLNLFLEPLDQVHSLRRRAEYEWSKRNFEEANRLYERAFDVIKIIVSLDEVQKDRNLRRSLQCQMADLGQNVRHSSKYAARAMRNRSTEVSLESPVVVDSSALQDVVQRKLPFDFSQDTLLLGHVVGRPRSVEAIRVQAKRKDKETVEIVEERKIACLETKKILEFEIASLRESRQRLSLLSSERDILLDRKGIREDKFIFGASLRKPRRSSEDDEVEEVRCPGLNVPEGYSLCFPLTSNDHTICSFVERQIKTDWEGETSNIGEDRTITEQARELDEELARLKGHLEVVNADNSKVIQEIEEVKAAIALLRKELEIPEDPVRRLNAHESESDTESNSLLPLSVPPAFSVPQTCLSDGLELLDDSDS